MEEVDFSQFRKTPEKEETPQEPIPKKKTPESKEEKTHEKEEKKPSKKSPKTSGIALKKSPFAKKTPKKVVSQESSSPNNYPIVIPDLNENSPLLSKVKKEEVHRIAQEFQLLKYAVKEVLDPSDLHEGTPKRSGVHKLQTVFNISTEIIEESYWEHNEEWYAKYKVKAIAPSGRFAVATGACNQSDCHLRKGKWTFHETLAIAETRASNRAILNLIGCGSVSDEEMR